MFGLGVAFQTDVFLKSLGVGALCGVLFAFFQGLRVLGLRSKAIVFVQDVSFFLIAGVLTFLFLLDVNFGVVRFYILVGEAVGFLILREATLPLMKSVSVRFDEIAKKRVQKRNDHKSEKTSKKLLQRE
jgi:spore cortex biosynthesis protein YabQ